MLSSRILQRIPISSRSLACGQCSAKLLQCKPQRVNLVLHRNASIHLRSDFIRKYKLEHITPMGWSLLAFPVITFGLGVWQIYRKQWKEALIAQIKEQAAQPPIDIPENLAELDKMEYRQVKVRGKFIHEKELYIGPRSFIDKSKTNRPALFSKQPTIGYLVVTPFKIDGREDMILVNRGWVPKDKLNPRTRPEGQVTDTVEVAGVVRKNEPRPQFTPKSKGRNYLYRDLVRMCDETGAEPFFIDATLESSIPGGPIGGQTNVNLRNEHVSYILTWFSLAFLSPYFWYKLVYLK